MIPAQYSEQVIAFEVVVEVASDGEHKTLQLSGQEGMKLLLWPGSYYRVIEYGIDSAKLEFLTPEEEMELALKAVEKEEAPGAMISISTTL